MKNLFKYVPLIILFSCAQNDTVQREIKLKEARKGYELINFSITNNKDINDTSAVYFNASIKTAGKDSVIEDSIFIVNDHDGVLLPFSSNPQNGNN